jgi:type I restriction enzyme M protein
LKKSKKDNATLFIDASAEFVRSGNKNKLADDNREKIMQAYVERKSITHFANLVPNASIATNDYNIAVSSYVEGENTSKEVDIHALNVRIAEIVSCQQALREAIDSIVADLEGGKA